MPTFVRCKTCGKEFLKPSADWGNNYLCSACVVHCSEYVYQRKDDYTTTIHREGLGFVDGCGFDEFATKHIGLICPQCGEKHL